MAKRKLGASVIILCIATVTLISGTYAWFLSGGAANLFDVGFDVIESSGNILLQGDAGTASGTLSEDGNWGTLLERKDFVLKDFIVDGGSYKPVSGSAFTQASAKFILVNLRNDAFESMDAPSKATLSNEELDQICYNDFTFKVKSGGEEIVGTSANGAYMTVDFIGREYKRDSQGNKTDELVDSVEASAAKAARVAVTFDGQTTIYSIDGESYKAVTSNFVSGITDTPDSSNQKDQIITESDTGSGAAALKTPAEMGVVSYNSLGSSENLTKIFLGNIPNTDSAGKEVTVRVWLEGNDKDCVDIAGRSIAGKNLLTKINFGIVE
ncbi:MAG: hypothetical protein IJT44_00845 [Clostridia bacterium]|nr:hypothetical protein [Clostridia bacterium]